MSKKAESYFHWLVGINRDGRFHKLRAMIMDDKKFPRKSKNYDSLVQALEVAGIYQTVFNDFEETVDMWLEYVDDCEAL